MTRLARLATWSISLLVSVLLLSGCGGGVKPIKSANKEIDEAERALESARNWKRQAEYDAATDSLRRAEDAVKSGRAFASGPEAKRLTNLGLEIIDEKSSVESARITAPKKREEKPVNVAVSEDPEEAKQKAAAEKKKKEDAEAAKRKLEDDARLNAATKAANTKKKEDDDTGKTVDVNPASGGKTEPGQPKEPEKPKGIGPYPAITTESPALDIIKIENRDKFALAYFQLYNKGEKGKRLMDIKVYFKDKDNQTLIPAQMCVVCPYSELSLKKKDLTDQSDTFTMGSAAVDGGGDARFVAIGEHDRARDVRKVGISVGYDDGSRESQTGPSKPEAAPDPGIKLK
jgi:hypothetical protein